MTEVDPDAARDLIAKIHAQTRAYPHDVYAVLYALMTVAGFVVNGTGPDALAVRRWAIDAFDQAIVGARRLDEERGGIDQNREGFWAPASR